MGVSGSISGFLGISGRFGEISETFKGVSRGLIKTHVVSLALKEGFMRYQGVSDDLK